MPELLKRPRATFAPGRGLLRNEHFQICYATNDLGRARDLFRDRYGIGEFRTLQGATPGGGHIHIELAWVCNTMYELATASGPGSDLFMERLPRDRFGLHLHHLGFLIHDQAGWDALEAETARLGTGFRHQNNTPGFLRHAFVDVPDLGHYLEFIFPEPAAIAFLEGVPGH